jgi:hypothetical protein
MLVVKPNRKELNPATAAVAVMRFRLRSALLLASFTKRVLAFYLVCRGGTRCS